MLKKNNKINKFKPRVCDNEKAPYKKATSVRLCSQVVKQKSTKSNRRTAKKKKTEKPR